jgi:hypothetical protein
MRPPVACGSVGRVTCASKEFGVPELAQRARAIWRHSERQLANDRDWEKDPPGRDDGASCWSPDGEESAMIARAPFLTVAMA